MLHFCEKFVICSMSLRDLEVDEKIGFEICTNDINQFLELFEIGV